VDDADNEGFDLRKAQQNFTCLHPEIISPVKLIFDAEYDPRRQIFYAASVNLYGHVRVVAPEQIFHLKSGLLLVRSTARDLFDLGEFLIRGKSVEDIGNAAIAQDRTAKLQRDHRQTTTLRQKAH
jgi:hypothetical protein